MAGFQAPEAATLNSAAPESAQASGWLKKRGRVNTALKQRWFVLEDGVLSYFSGTTAHMDLKGSISLANAQVQAGKQGFCINLIAASGRTYVLEARNLEDYKYWLTSLQRATTTVGVKFTPSYESPPPSSPSEAGTPSPRKRQNTVLATAQPKLQEFNLHGDRSPPVSRVPPPPSPPPAPVPPPQQPASVPAPRPQALDISDSPASSSATSAAAAAAAPASTPRQAHDASSSAVSSSPAAASSSSPAAASSSSGVAAVPNGRLVWLPVEDEDAWVAASVEKLGKGQVRATRLRAPPGVSLTLMLSEEELVQLLPVSGSLEEPVADLTQLESISTAAVLHTLRQRHASQHVYTAVGPIILALNPFAATAECSPERLAQLALVDDPDSLPPHVFNTARSAYSVMQRTGGPQAILISGESGAGKTETAKIVMSSIAKLSKSSAQSTSLALKSGLLLEAFGCARRAARHTICSSTPCILHHPSTPPPIQRVLPPCHRSS